MDSLPPEIIYQIVDFDPSIYSTVSYLSKYHRGCSELSYTHIIKEGLERFVENEDKRYEAFYNLDEAFWILSQHGDLKGVNACWKIGVRDPRSKHDLALRMASQYGHLEVVKYLTERLGIENAMVMDILGNAAESGHLDIVKYLIEDAFPVCKLESGSIIKAIDYSLLWASIYGRLNIVKYLVEEAPEPYKMEIKDIREINALGESAASGELEIVKYLIEEIGLDMEDIENMREGNNYALEMASCNGHIHVVKYLIEKVGLTVEDVEAMYWERSFL